MTVPYFIILFLCATAFGSIIGAYFTTADYRIRNTGSEPLVTARCYCPSCSHTLTLWQQIPIVSWIVLKGRCYYCHAPIPYRYPLTEGGFLLYYGISFLLLWKHPSLLFSSWVGAITILLLLRCRKHYRAAFHGILIFMGYHVLFGGILWMVLAALGA